MHKRQTATFYCFSPPVMLATFGIELVLAIYTLLRYKMTALTRLIAAELLMLGFFQLCEYHVCGGWGLSAEHWSRLGFAAITTLPAMGIHLLHQLAGKPGRKLVGLTYAGMAGFVGYFLFWYGAFTGYQCTGNYVIFQLTNRASWLYSAYYFGLLFLGIGLGMYWATEALKQGALTRLQTLRALVVGYLVFLVPTATAYSISPSARSAVPSIMCGFAVLFALILSFYILPRVGISRRKA